MRVLVRVTVIALLVSTVVFGRREYGVATVQVIPTRAEEIAAAVDGSHVFRLPFAASFLAVHWPGHADAAVSVELSADGAHFDAAIPVQLDEVGEGHPSGDTFGAIIAARGATYVRVAADRPLRPVSVLSLADGEARSSTQRVAVDEAGGADVASPSVTPRSGWGADEQLRFQRRRGTDQEIWPPTFARVQKLVVHHTATTNVDTAEEAMAELRAIYYYHAVTLGWGDIGYNFIVDRLGNIYEGRYSGTPPGSSPTGEDPEGRVVTAGHTYQHNVGTVGIAMLGDATLQPPTDAAQARMKELLAWEVARHQLDPAKTSMYRNVVNDKTIDRPNVAGHRDYVATACPGDQYYPLLPALRADLHVTVGDGDVLPPPPPGQPTATAGRRQITLSWPPSAESWPEQSGIAYYEIQRSPTVDGTFVAVEHTDDLTLTHTDTGIRGEFTYRVVAVDGAANHSAPSATVTARTS